MGSILFQIEPLPRSSLSAELLRLATDVSVRNIPMADLSDAFIAMPGGFGTLEEFCDVLSWSQLGLHAKSGGRP